MKNKLVAYFSASGVTAHLAAHLAEAVDADLHEIKPLVPYSDADLNWNDAHSRSSVEMKDKTSRPAIANHVEHMEGYDTIYIGFPIWWYTAPTIIHTFLEQYDLNGKTIVPFATSGGSAMGATNQDLAPSCPGAILKEGKRWNADASLTTLKNWAEQL